MPVVPWVTVAELPEGRPELPGGDEEWDTLALLATQVLFALSGRRWAGSTTRTVDVVAVGGTRWAELSSRADWWWDGSWGAHATVADGEVYNHDCCARPGAVRLPHAPVRRIESVTIGSTVRDPATYRIADGRWLVDTSGRGWPTCDPGMTVAYTAGDDPPAVAVDLAAQLTVQLGYARVGDARCRLPRNVTAVARQGITQSFVPATQIIAAGRTGLDEVDLWLGTVNPANRRHRPSSWSPDTHPRTSTRSEESL